MSLEPSRVRIFLEGQRLVGLRAEQPAAQERAALEGQRGVAGGAVRQVIRIIHIRRDLRLRPRRDRPCRIAGDRGVRGDQAGATHQWHGRRMAGAVGDLPCVGIKPVKPFKPRACGVDIGANASCGPVSDRSLARSFEISQRAFLPRVLF